MNIFVYMCAVCVLCESICMYVPVCMYISVHMCVCVLLRASICMYVPVCMYVCVHVCLCVHALPYVFNFHLPWAALLYSLLFTPG